MNLLNKEIIFDKNKSIIEVYLKILKEAKKIYGNNTIFFMQVGSFFEMYSLEDENKYLFKEVAEKLNLQITKRNKSIKEINIKNPLMAGIPLPAFQRYLDILIKENKYTIIIAEQITEPPNPKRKITKIISASTYTDKSFSLENKLLTIYIQNEDIKNSNIQNSKNISAGICIVDLTTNEIYLKEIYTYKDIKKTFLELEYIIEENSPKEILINLNDFKINENTKDFLINKLGINNNDYLVHFRNTTNAKKLKNIQYQNAILKELYKLNNPVLSPVEELDLELKPYALNSFIFSIKFIKEHNPENIINITKPIFIEDKNFLKLENHSLIQLNILSNNGQLGLIDILSKNLSTAIGKRFLKKRITKPFIEIDLINKYYEDTEKLIKNNLIKNIENKLINIYDIERLQRKISLNKLQPAEISQLLFSYQSILEIYKDILKKKNISFHYFLEKKEIDLLKEAIKYIKKNINIEIADKYNYETIQECIFYPELHEELDILAKKEQNIHNELQFIIKQFNNICEGFKLEKTDKEGYYIYVTNNVFKQFNNIIEKNNDFIYKENLKIKNLKSNKKIYIPELEKLSEELLIIENKIIKLTKELYKKFLQDFYNKYNKIFNKLIDFIGYIDYIKCNAKNSIEYNYNKPIINDKNKGISYFNAKNLRHPIIERFVPYVDNDIELKDKGILLYGVNASGKSSLMKSIGIAIIMAQAGLYVPAKLEYYPFKKLFTRISDVDNLYKGLSSFAVEMTELRTILKYADEYSLVLGDEISHGTEIISATAIVASAIINLVNKKAKFLFSTHLHNLNEISEIKKLKNLEFMHLEVFYDEKKEELIYDRKLKSGIGPTIYGLEVAKAMELDKDFLQLANKIRQEIINPKDKNKIDVLLNEEAKYSRYNKEVLLTKCYFCDNIAEHTHHIKFQKEFEKENKFKNIKYNLLPVCENCHEKIHNNIINIKGWKQINNQLVLDYEIKDINE